MFNKCNSFEEFMKESLVGKSNTKIDKNYVFDSLKEWMEDSSNKISEIVKTLQGNSNSIADYHIGNFMMINKLSLEDIKNNLSRRVDRNKPGEESYWYEDDRILTISLTTSIIGDKYECDFSVYAWYLTQKTVDITFTVDTNEA